MKGEETKSWKDLVKQHQFVKHFEKFFKAYTKSESPQLYELQLKSLPEISHHDKNLLICAPTGSGKTLVFEMIILKQLFKKHLKPKKNYSTFKVMYMAPTKAVCEEKKIQFQTHLSLDNTGLKLKVSYIENIMHRKQKKQIFDILKQSNIVICTPEMCNYILRKFNEEIIEKLDLFLVDEIHMIGCDSRGSNLEIIMDRFLSIQRQIQKMRIACVSASVSNQEEIAQWLNKAVLVQSLKRPVPLRLISLQPHSSFENPEYQSRNKSIIYRLVHTIRQIEIAIYLDHSQNYQRGLENYLIFCTSRADTKRNCQKLIQQFKKYQFSFDRKPPSISLEQVEALFEQQKIINQELKACLRERMGYHHANLLDNQKKLVIKLMKLNWIIVLFSTSTLAQGVNLPVKVVILMMLAKNVEEDQQVLYSWSQIDQMIGRAGRDKKDQMGYCCFMDKSQYVQKFSEAYDAQNQQFKFKERIQPIKSNLVQKFEDFLFFEAAYRNLNVKQEKNVKIFIDHFKQSLWVIQNRSHFQTDPQIEKFLRDEIEEKSRQFQQYNLNNTEIRNQLYMDLFFSVKTYKDLFNELNKQNRQTWMSHRNFLETICQIDEIVLVHRYTKEDKLGPLKKQAKVPIKCKFKNELGGKVKYSRNKAMLLIQIIFMGKISILDQVQAIKLEAFEIMNIFKRACKLVRLIHFNSPRFIEEKLCDPGAVFFSELYLKYCNPKSKKKEEESAWNPEKQYSEYASHMNLSKCYKLLRIDQSWLNTKKKLIKQSNQTIGFFLIKNYFQDNFFEKSKNGNLQKARNIVLSYQIKVLPGKGPYKVSRFAMDEETMRFYLFEQQAGKYHYVGSFNKKLQFEKNDGKQYLLLVVYENKLGLDSVFRYSAGKVTPVHFSNDFLDEEPKEQEEDEDEEEEEEDKEESSLQLSNQENFSYGQNFGKKTKP